MSTEATKQMFLLKRASIALAPYFDSCTVSYAEGGFRLKVKNGSHSFTIEPNKRLLDVIRFIEKIEPAVVGGKVKQSDVKDALLAIFLPSKATKFTKTKYRRLAGLLNKHKKLQSFLIWRRKQVP